MRRTPKSHSELFGEDAGSYIRGVASLWAMLQPEDRARQLKRGGLLALSSLSDLLILYSLTQALELYRLEQGVFREMLVFALALATSQWSTLRLQEMVSIDSTRFVATLRGRLLAKLDAIDLISFERVSKDALFMRITADAEALHRAGANLVGIVSASATVVLAMGYVALNNVGPAALTLALMCGLAFASALQVKALSALFRRTARLRDRFHRSLRSFILGFKQARQHAPRRRSLLGELSGQINRLQAERVALADREVTFETASQIGFQLVLVFIAFGVPLLFPEAEASRPTLLISVFFVFKPISQLFSQAPALSEAAVAASRVVDIEDALDEIRQARTRAARPDVPEGLQRLALSGAAFTYPPKPGAEQFGIGPLDFSLDQDETVFVTGANGSGKSTFLKVLVGLYDRDHGDLTLNGVSLPIGQAEPVRERCAVIFTDFVLFERLHGLDHLSAEEVNAMLEDMGLGEVVRYDGERLSTLDLSTGQRKRLAMAIARLSKRPFMVLDEWAADQDPVFRARFYRELLPGLRDAGTTVLAVTHDDDYFHIPDRRVHFADGQVVEAE